MTKQEKIAAEIRPQLKKLIKPTSTLTINITKVSRSGMCRRMKVYTKDSQDITAQIAQLCDLSTNDNGLKITGYGMDMAFWLADNITYCLYPNKAERESKKFTGNGGNCIDWRVL